MVVVNADCDAGESPSGPQIALRGENLAYLIYTSGSTGQPKGVMVSRSALLNRLTWMQDCYGLQPGEGILHKTPHGFDVSLWELLWPLMAGGRVVIARPGGQGDPEYLVQVINRNQVSRVHFVPSMLGPFLDELSATSCPSLEQIVCSGEALTAELVRQCYSASAAAVDNLYGPTEASIDVTAWRCRPGESGAPGIGVPIANTWVYVLDEGMEPVPVGVMGQLYIGGAGLARGYLGRPGLTAGCFVPDPYGRPGGRLYATGDLARWRVDGSLEFGGRMDQQVKVRGYRVEPGEVEAALREHPDVGDAVVVASGAGAERRLVAYYVSAVAGQPGPGVLRGFLGQRLPGYLVPSQYVWLAELPLTGNGKVDKKALPDPGGGRPDLDVAYEAPQTDSEQAVASVWAKVLGIDRVGRHDNFFQLGGDSLHAVRLVALLALLFGVSLPVPALFSRPTVAGIADECDQLVAQVGRAAPPAPAPVAPASAPTEDARLRIERRPLLSLFATGQIEPVDAAAICAIPEVFLGYRGLSPAYVVSELFQDMPAFSSVTESALGRLAAITIYG